MTVNMNARASTIAEQGKRATGTEGPPGEADVTLEALIGDVASLSDDAQDRIAKILRRDVLTIAQIAAVDMRDAFIALQERERLSKVPKDRPSIILGAGTKEPWGAVTGWAAIQLLANSLQPGGLAGNRAVVETVATYPNDQYSQAAFSGLVGGSANSYAGMALLVRGTTTAATCYFLVINQAATNNATLEAFNAGSSTDIWGERAHNSGGGRRGRCLPIGSRRLHATRVPERRTDRWQLNERGACIGTAGYWVFQYVDGNTFG